MSDECWIVCVANYDARNTFCPAIGVECVGCRKWSVLRRPIPGIEGEIRLYRRCMRLQDRSITYTFLQYLVFDQALSALRPSY